MIVAAALSEYFYMMIPITATFVNMCRIFVHKPLSKMWKQSPPLAVLFTSTCMMLMIDAVMVAVWLMLLLQILPNVPENYNVVFAPAVFRVALQLIYAITNAALFAQRVYIILIPGGLLRTANKVIVTVEILASFTAASIGVIPNVLLIPAHTVPLPEGCFSANCSNVLPGRTFSATTTLVLSICTVFLGAALQYVYYRYQKTSATPVKEAEKLHLFARYTFNIRLLLETVPYFVDLLLTNVQGGMDGNAAHVFVGPYDFCDLAEQLANSRYYKAVLGVRLVATSLGALMCAFLLRSKVSWIFVHGYDIVGDHKMNTIILHVHARILLKYHIIVSLLLAVNYFAITVFEIVRTMRDVHYCDHLMPRWLSFWPHFVTGNLVYCQTFSSFFIIVERLLCTFRIRTYELLDLRKPLLLFLAIMTGSIIFISYFMLVRTASWEMSLFYLAFEDPGNMEYGTAYMFAHISVDFFSMIICKVVHVLNRRAKKVFLQKTVFLKKQLGSQLSSKLQIRQNIALSSTLMPVVFFHFVISAGSALVISLFALTNWKNDLVTTILVAESFAVFPLYSIIMPAVFHCSHRTLTLGWTESFFVTRGSKVGSVTDGKSKEFERFFKMFDEMMENARSRS
uniref:G protein-coupled receptor n=2 Tax=Steinernema glaseri TaxID=37863 RepID=A0A1I7YD06_9BILA